MYKFKSIKIRDRFEIKKHVLSKIIFSYLIVFLLSSILLSVIYYYNIKKSQEKTYHNYNNKLLESIVTKYESYLTQLEELSLVLRSNEPLMYDLLDNNLFYSLKEDLQFTNYSNNNSLGISKVEYHILSLNKTLVMEKHNYFPVYEIVENWDWYRKLLDSENYYYVEAPEYCLEKDSNELNIIFHRSIIDIPTNMPMIIMNLYIKHDFIKNMVDFGLTNGYEQIYLFNDNNELFYTNFEDISTDFLKEIQEKYRKSDNYIKIDGVDYIKSVVTSNSGEWLLLKISELEYINSSINDLFSIGFVVILLFLLVIIMVGLYFVKGISDEINVLVHFVNRVGEGDFNQTIHFRHDNELAFLANSFNDMTRRLKVLIDRNYKLKIQEKEAMLRMIESQIDPHFLYNTLQAIGGLALEKQNYELNTSINTLASSFRYKISQDAFTTIYDEIEYIKTYVTLFKLRFKERINIEYDIDFDTYDILIPRMMYQILVENTIKHAVEKTSDIVNVNIQTCIEDGRLIIRYADDGCGLNSAELIDLNRHLADRQNWKTSHIGLMNIHERLILNNMDLEEFRIESEKGKFFSVLIKINFKEL